MTASLPATSFPRLFIFGLFLLGGRGRSMYLRLGCLYAESRIERIPVPTERPGQPGERQDEQKEGGVKASCHMQVVEETIPAGVRLYFQAILQRLPVTGIPDDKAAYEDDGQYECGVSYKRFPQ